MTGRHYGAAILLLAFAFEAQAASRTVVVTATSADPDHGLTGAVIQLKSATDDGASHAVSLDASGSATITLPAESHWIASSGTAHYWMPAELLNAGADAAPLRVQYRMWPTGTLKGAIQFAATRRKKVQVLSVAAEKVPGRNSAVPSFDVECPLDAKGNWKCPLPAAILDLSFRVADSAAAYRWDVAVQRGTTRDLGTLILHAGSSVTGWARTEDRKTMAAGARATLTRVVAGQAPPRLAERLSRPVAQASVAPNGFFQLTGVDSGTYRLNVVQRGYATATVYPIDVTSGTESRIKQVVTVRRPLTLRATVVPPRDWTGQLWTVSISRMRDFSTSPDGPPIFEAKTDETGGINVPGQSPGTFRATVYDSENNPFQTVSFTVSTELDAPSVLEVHTLRVTGHVQRGGHPLSAALSFGGRHGAPRVDARSDADGRFSAVLPRGGHWRVEVDSDEGTSTFVETDVADAHDTADIELVLPSNRIVGIVLDEDDRPVAGASIAYTLKGMVVERSGADGTFVFHDVPIGRGTLSAQTTRGGHQRQSENVSVDMAEGGNAGPIELRLRSAKHVSGEVRSPRGIVAGAMVSIMSNDRSLGFYSRATTNADGVFDFDVPTDLPEAVFIVSPPGFALRAFAAPLDGREVVLTVPGSGGTLRCRVEPAEGTQRLALSIEQDGKILPLPDLAHWAGASSSPASGGNAWDIPNLSAGHYRICVMKMTSTPAPPYGCSEGDLAPSGQLELAPKLP